MDAKDLANRFGYHRPADDDVVRKHQAIRTSFRDLADLVNELVPESREKSLAITALEEGMFWANAGIARMDSDTGERREPTGG